MVMINISNKAFYLLVGLLGVLVVAGVGIAYVADGSGTPAVMGHSAGELAGVCLSNGTNCLDSGPVAQTRKCVTGTVDMSSWLTVSLLVDGENICESVHGCDVIVYSNDATSDYKFSFNDVVVYVQRSNKAFGISNTRLGVNGDGNKVVVTDSSACKVRDDYPDENSGTGADDFSLQADGNKPCTVSICQRG
jgi:hypothetical protein